VEESEKPERKESLFMQHENSIRNIHKAEWNLLLGKQSVFDWDGLLFLEEAFSGNTSPEHNWSFHYLIVRDEKSRIILATFFTQALWKDDLLAPTSVSVKLEAKRKREPYYLTSPVLGMGSLFTEGEHCYLDKSNAQWREAIHMLLSKIETLGQKGNAAMIALRDFNNDDELSQLFHHLGFVQIDMPESCTIEDVSWTDTESYVRSLSPRSRRHFRQDIEPYEKHFDIFHKESASKNEGREFFELYENVRSRNFDLNTFAFPEKLFLSMSDDPHWEFIVLYLKHEYDLRPVRTPVGVMFCYKNMDHTYVPAFIGMDYDYTQDHQIYRQLLFQTIKRARDLSFKKINFGLTASFEKRKVGASVTQRVAYVQARDNFSMGLIGLMQDSL
jgi:predicted N-acyltransferase